MTSKEALEELLGRAISNPYVGMVAAAALEKDLDKLDQYKTIEKELGIDLITLFKAQTQGYIWELVFAYYDEDGKQVYKPRKQERWLGIDFRAKALVGHWVDYEFEDYGKTWALTKEELEENGIYKNR